MTTTDLILSPHVKESHDLSLIHLSVAYKSNAIESETSGHSEQDRADKFSHWCMPEEPTGYIKHARPDLL